MFDFTITVLEVDSPVAVLVLVIIYGPGFRLMFRVAIPLSLVILV